MLKIDFSAFFNRTNDFSLMSSLYYVYVDVDVDVCVCVLQQSTRRLFHSSILPYLHAFHSWFSFNATLEFGFFQRSSQTFSNTYFSKINFGCETIISMLLWINLDNSLLLMCTNFVWMMFWPIDIECNNRSRNLHKLWNLSWLK